MKYLLFLIALLTYAASIAQQPVHVSVKNISFAATDSLLPFRRAAAVRGKFVLKVSG
jgi:hypothetical protein